MAEILSPKEFDLQARIIQLEKELALKNSSQKSPSGKRGKAESPLRGISKKIDNAAKNLKAKGIPFSSAAFLKEMGEYFPGAARLRGHFKEWGGERRNPLYLPLPDFK